MNFIAITRRIRRCESEVPAQLVLEHAISEAVKAEREACAQIAETPVSGEQDDITMEAKDRIAAAIRKRSNVQGKGPPERAARREPKCAAFWRSA